MNVLVIDCSARWMICGLISHEGQSIHNALEFHREAPRESSTRLAVEIQSLVRQGGLPDWIACSLGPGSFTGIRIGVTTARDLAQLWNIPVCGIDTLTLYAASIMSADPTLLKGGFALMIDGRQNRYYTKAIPSSRIADIHAEPIHDLAPAEYPERIGLPKVITDEPGALRWPDVDVIPLEGAALTARSFAQSALSLFSPSPAGKWQDLLPIYVRNDPARAKFPTGLTKSNPLP